MLLAPVGAGFCVEAGVGDAQALYGAAGDEMLGNDGVSVFRFDVAVPDGIGVDDNVGAMLALVEAAGFVDADLAAQAGLLGELLQTGVQLALAIGCAGAARSVSMADVVADKDMAFKGGQGDLLSAAKMGRLTPE